METVKILLEKTNTREIDEWEIGFGGMKYHERRSILDMLDKQRADYLNRFTEELTEESAILALWYVDLFAYYYYLEHPTTADFRGIAYSSNKVFGGPFLKRYEKHREYMANHPFIYKNCGGYGHEVPDPKEQLEWDDVVHTKEFDRIYMGKLIKRKSKIFPIGAMNMRTLSESSGIMAMIWGSD